MSIKVLGPWPAWDTQARSGLLERADGSTAAVLLHADAVGGPASLDAARKEGRQIGRVRHAAVLHLKQVMLLGGVPTWVHDGFDGVSLSRLIQELLAQGRRVPVRVVVEIAAAVVDAIGDTWTTSDGAGHPVVHPGVTPGHVLLSRSGQLKVAGFRAPPPGQELPSPAGYRPPEGGHRGPALVYGVGALLAELLTGELPPASASDSERHASVVRRALIRVLSRPGARVPESVVEIVRQCLLFRAGDRPSLPRLAVELCRIADGMPQAPLQRWAADTLPGLWTGLVAVAPAGQAPPVRPLPMSVGPMPRRSSPVDVGPLDLDLGPAATTEAGTAALRILSQDAATENDTEEVEPTQEVTEAPAEVTVSTPAPGSAAVADGSAASGSAGESTAMSHFEVPARSPAAIAPARDDVGRGAGPVLGRGVLDDDEAIEWRPRRRIGPWLVAGVAAAVVLAGGLWWKGQRGASADEVPDEASPAALGAASAGSSSAEEAPAEEVPAEEVPAEEVVAEATPEADPPAASLTPAVQPPTLQPTITQAPITRARSSASTGQRASRPDPGDAYVPPEDPPAPIIVEVPAVASQPPAVVAEAPAAPPYTLRFSSAYSGVVRMDVSCHGGRTGSGLSVTITGAVPGPCKVEGTTVDGGRLVALVSASRDRSWACFESGERSCR